MTNNGPSDATNLVINVTVPEGLDGMTITPSVGTYDSQTSQWTIDSLNEGDTAKLEIGGTVNTLDPLSSSAKVDSVDAYLEPVFLFFLDDGQKPVKVLFGGGEGGKAPRFGIPGWCFYLFSVSMKASFTMYKAYCETQALASAYYNHYAQSLTYADADLRAKEAENADAYSSYTFNTYYLAASRFLSGGTTDAEGNTTYSDAETAASVAAAEEAAKALISTENQVKLSLTPLSTSKTKKLIPFVYIEKVKAESRPSPFLFLNCWLNKNCRENSRSAIIRNTYKYIITS